MADQNERIHHQWTFDRDGSIVCGTNVERDTYGLHFKRVRMDAARRLNRPEIEDRSFAAREIGISESFLKKLESGEKRPAFETLQAMARTYNCFEGDLLPSMAPKGTDADRILGPLFSIPEPTRSLFVTQMEAFARTLAAGMALQRSEFAQPELRHDISPPLSAGANDESFNPITHRTT